MQEDDFDLLIKVVIIGDSGVGKSNLLLRFDRNEFSESTKSTIGVDFAGKMMKVNDLSVKAQFWDTAGQDQYRAITPAYYKNACGAILVYDITKLQSFDNIPNWLKELKQYCEADVSCILLGNKNDLQEARQIQDETGQSYAKSKGMFFMEVSAKENTENNVMNAFNTQIEEIVSRKEKELEKAENVDGMNASRISMTQKENKKKCGCSIF